MIDVLLIGFAFASAFLICFHRQTVWDSLVVVVVCLFVTRAESEESRKVKRGFAVILLFFFRFSFRQFRLRQLRLQPKHSRPSLSNRRPRPQLPNQMPSWPSSRSRRRNRSCIRASKTSNERSFWPVRLFTASRAKRRRP